MFYAEIMSEPAGRNLDRWVAEFMADRYDCDDNWWYSADGSKSSHADRGPREYSGKIEAAWAVHRHCVGKIFSKRQRYCKELTHVLRQKLGGEAEFAWPDLLGHLEPVDICRAALLSVSQA